MKRLRRLFRWTCFSCGESGEYNPRTFAGIVHRVGCPLEEEA